MDHCHHDRDIVICALFLWTELWQIWHSSNTLQVRELTGDLLLAVQVEGAVKVFPPEHVLGDHDPVFIMAASLDTGDPPTRPPPIHTSMGPSHDGWSDSGASGPTA